MPDFSSNLCSNHVRPLLRCPTQTGVYLQIPNVIVESESPTKEQEASSLAIEDASGQMEGADNHSTSAPMQMTTEVSQPLNTDANHLPGKQAPCIAGLEEANQSHSRLHQYEWQVFTARVVIGDLRVSQC